MKDRYTERQMKRLFDFTDSDLSDIRNGDINFGHCEICGLYFDGLVAEQVYIEDHSTIVDHYCARRLPKVNHSSLLT